VSGYVILNGMEKCCEKILLSDKYSCLSETLCHGSFDENLSWCLLENFNSDQSSVMFHLLFIMVIYIFSLFVTELFVNYNVVESNFFLKVFCTFVYSVMLGGMLGGHLYFGGTFCLYLRGWGWR
jgi:hypothetical protein